MEAFLIATGANHAFAGALGAWITAQVSPLTIRWVLGLGFLAMAVWTLIPDKIDEETEVGGKLKLGSSAPPWWPSSWPRWVTKRWA